MACIIIKRNPEPTIPDQFYAGNPFGPWPTTPASASTYVSPTAALGDATAALSVTTDNSVVVIKDQIAGTEYPVSMMAP